MKTEITERRQTAFRLRKDLLDKLKKEAAKENRSVNNYVETLLLDAVYREPNEETLEAMIEVESGIDLETLDMDDFKKFMASL
ncbi:MAG: toxin-antitoxin system protein [Candidatus Moranbacteria bacterium]|nr:toxin-antitoxin system protein [Candidatus Moranbacteria bacterium]